ncbi:MAG: ABC transporter permease [Candidatus Dormibacteria bacterium]
MAATRPHAARALPALELEAAPLSRRRLLSDLWGYRAILLELAKVDFRLRYKRAAFGLMWAVGLPLLQAAVLAIVFSRAIRLSPHLSHAYAVYILSGVLAWNYLALTVSSSSTAIVDASDLTSKLWFPRSVLPLVPVLSNLPGLLISMIILLILTPLLGVPPTAHLLLLVPGVSLLVTFSAVLSLVLAALHVYFRDTRYFVQASLLLLFYATPILYPPRLLKEVRWVFVLNPFTGIIATFHAATVGDDGELFHALTVTLAVLVLLVVIFVEVYRRHDRLFADRL